MATARFSGIGRTTGLRVLVPEPVRAKKAGNQLAPAPATYEAQVRVLFELDGLGMTYVEDENRKRYFIDGDSNVPFKAVKGQVLMAQVTPAGYVYSARLLPK